MMISKLKSLGIKIAAAVPVAVTAVTLFARKAGATAVTYTPLISGTDTKDTFDQVVTDYKAAILGILVTLGVAMVALAWMKFGFRGAAAGGLPGRKRR